MIAHENIRVLTLPDAFRDDCIVRYLSAFGANALEDPWMRGGFGAKLAEHLWNTDQFCTELIIYNSFIRHYEKISENDLNGFGGVVFIPFFLSLALRAQARSGRSCFDSIMTTVEKYDEVKFCMVFSGIGQDIFHLGFKIPKNLTILNIESQQDDYSRVSIPYPSNYHDFEAFEVVAPGSRNHTLCLVANFRPGLRGGLIHQLNQQGNPRAVVQEIKTESDYVWMPTVESAIAIDSLRRDSIYSLEPYGDSPSRKGIFDSIASGTIPVLFNPNAYRLPFASYIDWSKISEQVYIYGYEFISSYNGKKYENIYDLLNDIPLELAERKIENIKRMRSAFSYSENYEINAWTMIVKSYLNRIINDQ